MTLWTQLAPTTPDWAPELIVGAIVFAVTAIAGSVAAWLYGERDVAGIVALGLIGAFFLGGAATLVTSTITDQQALMDTAETPARDPQDAGTPPPEGPNAERTRRAGALEQLPPADLEPSDLATPARAHTFTPGAR